jgi:hypothetical protein
MQNPGSHEIAHRVPEFMTQMGDVGRTQCCDPADCLRE